MGSIWGDLSLLTGTNVFCQLLCVATVFSFRIQANFVHWKTTKNTFLCMAVKAPLFLCCPSHIQTRRHEPHKSQRDLP